MDNRDDGIEIESKKSNLDLMNLEEITSKEELDHLKKWLFKENIRIQQEKTKVEDHKKRVLQEEDFLQKKLEVLKNAYKQLDIDKRKLEKEKTLFDSKKEQSKSSPTEYYYDKHLNYFKGVNSLLSLKKRYKDLIKIFHPDNLCGDTDTIQMINREYDSLRKIFDYNKQA